MFSNQECELLGFKYIQAKKLGGWLELPIFSLDTWEIIKKCPCCARIMNPVVSFINHNKSLEIQLGQCPNCHYVTYLNRPSKVWLDNFYSETWDKKKAKKREELVGIKPKKSKIAEMISSLSINKNDMILEVGSGYGGTLLGLQEIGFNNLIGIENSLHRAQLSRETRNLEVLNGNFLNQEFIQKIKSKGPFRVICSAHVLEHMHDPLDFFSQASTLQNEGDYLVLSLPNLIGEPAMDVLMFLPHLQSFTKKSIKEILGKFNYQPINTTLSNETEISVIARKIGKAKISRDSDNAKIKTEYADLKEKLIRELWLLRNSPETRHLWWIKASTKSGQWSSFQNLIFSPFYKFRSILIRNLIKKLTISPIEIQFDENIVMFYK